MGIEMARLSVDPADVALATRIDQRVDNAVQV